MGSENPHPVPRERTVRPGIDQIASDAGFVTAVTLRHHFQQTLGTSPTTYRQQFRQAA